ncbi:hypothetical protein [Streptomyces sp. VB1]|uniref:hypothetical protein n=1 Tax=Streptomyces sp. VB1 TaxID=2986803 RepID=UPI002242677D|nr:hypothetical protein [Streptomyces sp. VB1]UZI27916.1 hypothetical protein OH133_07125 [Streptomyces sp. VB1]
MSSKPPLPHRTPHHTSATTAHVPVPPGGLPGAAKVQEALDARDALATALSRAGIQLPAMDVRTPWADALREDGTPSPYGGGENTDDPAQPATERSGEVRYALVHLGVCSAPVAHALATAITDRLAR